MTSARAMRRVARITLGCVWLYQGLVPKLVAAVPLELAIVERTGLFLVDPTWTVRAVGLLEIALGLWLLSGVRERLAAALTSALLIAMTAVVVVEEPALLLGPFGGIVKNLGLFACAWIVWKR